MADMKIALVISFIFSGLGIAYAGNLEKGLIIFASVILCNIFGFIIHPIFGRISVLIWIYGLYATYTEVNQLEN